MRAKRLRAVALGDFRRSEATLLTEWCQAHPDIKLRADDCVAFLSGTRTQIVFVSPPLELENVRPSGRGREFYTCVASQRLRLDGGWDALMLQNHAERVGIDLGLRRFESYLKQGIREAAEAE